MSLRQCQHQAQDCAGREGVGGHARQPVERRVHCFLLELAGPARLANSQHDLSPSTSSGSGCSESANFFDRNDGSEDAPGLCCG